VIATPGEFWRFLVQVPCQADCALEPQFQAVLYIERWLKAPFVKADGTLVPRSQGVPKGSVIGPVMMNLFMHYCFDRWMQEKHPYCPFARYADDAVVHCSSQLQAK
jgi:RNA-directed DNA polymerase